MGCKDDSRLAGNISGTAVLVANGIFDLYIKLLIS